MKAFPNGFITNKDGLIVGSQSGMELRDFFAKDFAAVLMNSTNITHHEEYIQSVCKQAYVWADAMMKAREQ